MFNLDFIQVLKRRPFRCNLLVFVPVHVRLYHRSLRPSCPELLEHRLLPTCPIQRDGQIDFTEVPGLSIGQQQIVGENTGGPVTFGPE